MRLKTNQIIKLARSQLLELTTDVLSEDAVMNFLNLTYQDLQMRVLDNSRLLTVTLVTTSGEADLPENFAAFYGKPIDEMKQPVRIMPLQGFIRASDGDRVATKSGNKIKVKGNITSLSLVYYTFYDVLEFADTPETHAYLDECLVQGIIYRALKHLQDPELAQVEKNSYDAMVEEKSALISLMDENATETELFNPINFID